MSREKSIERAKDIIKTLRSGEECDKDSLIKELKDIEDKYRLIFY